MVKQQFKEADANVKLASVRFRTCNPQQTRQQAQVPVSSKQLYHGVPGKSHTISLGPLDNRLGVTLTSNVCATCGKNLQGCVGHFGYTDLELPVFHVGFFRAIIRILQCICKNCSCVLLKPEAKMKIRNRLKRQNMPYSQKKALCKEVIDLCKKTLVCPSCSYRNGLVKKLAGAVLKIVHVEPESVNLDEFAEAVENNKELKALLPKCRTTLLSPLDADVLFEHIPAEDVELLLMDPEVGHPSDLLLKRIPVPPLCIRPSVVCPAKAGTNEDDITVRLSEIVFINEVLRKHMISGAKMQMVKEAWDFLQVQCALYMDSELSGLPMNMAPKTYCRSFAQRLKGKHGRFRGNLSGKRVDFTARTVISPEPNLRLDQVGVPEEIAKILTYPEKVNRCNIEAMRKLVINGAEVHPGANFLIDKKTGLRKYLKFGRREILARHLSYGDTVERHMMDGDVVLFNRQPSLHRVSIMAHFAKILPYRTLRFNECVCTPYNADFDGDEMNLHLPQTEEAKAEARELMGVKNNLITPRNGEPLIAATQDFITGAYLLTHKDMFFSRSTVCLIISQILRDKDATMRIDLPPPAIIKPTRMWTGKQVFSLILKPNMDCSTVINLSARGRNYAGNLDLCPNDSYVIIRNSRLLCGVMDKSTVGSGSKTNVFYILFRDHGPQLACDTMWRLARIAPTFLSNYGLSFGIGDVTPSLELNMQKADLLQEGYGKCDEYIRQYESGKLKPQPGCTEKDSLEAMTLRELSAIRDRAGKACVQTLSPHNSALIMALCGSKGSNINISQMIACVGQQAISGKRPKNDFLDRTLPYFQRTDKSPGTRGFVENSFYSGLIPMEFFFHAMAGREGLIDTAVKTAETGYIQRRLVKCLEDLCVSYDDTVRTSSGEVVQFMYGDDGRDPLFIEGKEKVVDFDHVFEHMKNQYLTNDMNERLSPDQLEDIFKSKQNLLLKCSPLFQTELEEFYHGKLKTIRTYYERSDCCDEHEDFGFFKKCSKCCSKKSAKELLLNAYSLNHSQASKFLDACLKKYRKATMEPGTAVGAIAATSIGEPSTQMTLKTFHFAGVASMNITQGVPRIKEIINAVKNIRTPVITAFLTKDNDEKFARRVKARIEKTTVGEVTEYIQEVYLPDSCFVLIKLSLSRIRLLQLEITRQTIIQNIVNGKLHVPLTYKNVIPRGQSFICIYPEATKMYPLRSAIEYVKREVMNVIVQGYPGAAHCMIEADSKKGDTFKLLVEGTDFLKVLGTKGVNAAKTTMNSAFDVFKVLGIEAARTVIISEILSTMAAHGIGLDRRHVMLLADLMTFRGEILGITRHGMTKLKESVLMLASFEQTTQHLYEAAYYGQKDPIRGVSESIIMGQPIPLGTGSFDILHKPHHAPKQRFHQRIKHAFLLDSC